MLAMFRRGLFYSYLSVYMRHFLGMSVTETTLFATLPMVVNVVCQRYVWGVVSDRYQKRRALVIWGEILAGIGTLAVWWLHLLPQALQTSGHVIILGLCVIEIFWSMSNIGWSALISDLYDRGDRSRVMGRLESLGGIGRIAGIWAGGLLYDGLGLAYAGWGFYSGVLFFLSAGVMFVSVLPMLMVPEGGVDAQDASPGSGESDAWMPGLFFLFLVAMTFVNFGRNSVSVTFSQYLMLDSGFSLSSIMLSYVANIRSVAMVVTGLATGRLAQGLGSRRLLLAGSVAAMVSLFVLGAADTLVAVCISSFLMGFSEVAVLAASYELAAALIPPTRRGTLFSLFNATFFLSWGMAGTLIAGPVTDFLISQGRAEVLAYKVSFLVAAGITLVGTFMLFFVFRFHKSWVNGTV